MRFLADENVPGDRKIEILDDRFDYNEDRIRASAWIGEGSYSS